MFSILCSREINLFCLFLDSNKKINQTDQDGNKASITNQIVNSDDFSDLHFISSQFVSADGQNPLKSLSSNPTLAQVLGIESE